MVRSGTHFGQDNRFMVETDGMAIGGNLEFKCVIFAFNESGGTDLKQFWMNVPCK